MAVIRNTSKTRGRSSAIRLQTALLCLALTITLHPLHALGETPVASPDTLQQLDELIVSAGRSSFGRITSDGSVELDASGLTNISRFFGEADLMRLTRTQGGVASTSDYSAGPIVDGMDNSQNGYSINGVPVHFPYHFGGIFSVFSPWQYPRLTMSRSARQAGSMPVLGSEFSIRTSPNHPDAFHCSANLGLTASSAGVEIPVTNKFSIIASARLSYIDAIYGDLLSIDDAVIHYGFHDVDLAARYQTGSHSSLSVFGHYNSDKLHYDDSSYDMKTGIRWHNILGGTEWHNRNVSIRAYYTEMMNTLQLEMQNICVGLPSSVREAGVAGQWGNKYGIAHIRAGARANYYRVRPQDISVVGMGSAIYPNRITDTAYQSSLWGSVAFDITDFMTIEAGADAEGYYTTNNYHNTAIDPRLTFKFHVGRGTLSIHGGGYHQYIHQVGFSEIGMPSNFKLAASGACPPQQSLNASIAYSTTLPLLNIKASADIYYRRVLHQPEYFGGILSVLSQDYKPEQFISICNGYNYGASVTLSRDFTALSFIASYSYGIARRRLPGTDTYFTASSQIMHALNLSASYRFPGDHWSVNANFTYMSGRPITQVRGIYFIGQYLMIEYGKRNAAHMPDYHRLDIGASYSSRTGKVRHTVSLSVINCYGHANAEIPRYGYNSDTGMLKFRYVSSLFRFLPSISYSIDL